MSETRQRVAVIGATGYTGGELVALLARHPRVTIVALQGSPGRKESAPFSSLHPSLRGMKGAACEALSIESVVAARPDWALLCTPNETSAEVAAPLLRARIRVIDLSGAHRLPEGDHERWYGFPHAKQDATYSVPELFDGDLRSAMLIANPGCYATSVILALAPIVPLLHPTEAVIADCKSGVSGAGKRAEAIYSFTELAGNFKAYATTGHRHEPEIRRALGLGDRAFVFVPHLLPVVRGILSTLHVPLSRACDAEEIAALYARYEGTLVGVRSHGTMPELADVVGTPRAELGFQLSSDRRRLLVVSVLDNLLKGAASQAVQNLNLACGFHQLDGLQGRS